MNIDRCPYRHTCAYLDPADLWKYLPVMVGVLWYFAFQTYTCELGLTNVLKIAVPEDSYIGWLDQQYRQTSCRKFVWSLPQEHHVGSSAQFVRLHSLSWIRQMCHSWIIISGSHAWGRCETMWNNRLKHKVLTGVKPYCRGFIVNIKMFEGSLEAKLPTIWTVETQSREEAERRERLEEIRGRCAKR